VPGTRRLLERASWAHGALKTTGGPSGHTRAFPTASLETILKIAPHTTQNRLAQPAGGTTGAASSLAHLFQPSYSVRSRNGVAPDGAAGVYFVRIQRKWQSLTKRPAPCTFDPSNLGGLSLFSRGSPASIATGSPLPLSWPRTITCTCGAVTAANR
jgi:hypothetical protein